MVLLLKDGFMDFGGWCAGTSSPRGTPAAEHSLFVVDVALSSCLPPVTSILSAGDQTVADQDAEDEDYEGGKNDKKDEVHQRVRS